jgi:peptidoglycan/xylan/chitin deacetylase (PgdA/CDA1 family)
LTVSAILTYHSLDDGNSPTSLPPPVFRRQMETLVRQGIRVVPLAEILAAPGAVALTFDDGYANFLLHALPVLEQYRLPVAVFVVTGRWAAAPTLELMSWSDLARLAQAGVTLGAHTVHHPMRDCRAELEDRTGQAVEALAYPYGISTPAVRRLAREHFRLACGTALRFLSRAEDPWDLPRIDVHYLRRRFWFEQLMRPGGRAYLTLRRGPRQLRQWLQQRLGETA